MKPHTFSFHLALSLVVKPDPEKVQQLIIENPENMEV